MHFTLKKASVLVVSGVLVFGSALLGGCASKTIAGLSAVQDPGAEKIMERFEAKPMDASAQENAIAAAPPVVTAAPTPAPIAPAVGASAKGKKSKRGKKDAKLSAAEATTLAASGESSTAAAPSPTPTPSPTAVVVPNRRPGKSPFRVGELMVLDITYLGMIAGQFELELLPSVAINGRKAYHFEGRARTSKLFNIVYSVNDKIESFFDMEGLFSHKFHMLLDQTKQKRDSLELFDYEKKQSYFWNRKNHVTKGYSEVKEYNAMEPFSQDPYSAYEFMRTLPLENGKAYHIPVVSEGKAWDGVATVVAREEISTSIGRRAAIRIKLQTSFQGVLKQGNGDSFIWLSDDDRRFILQIEAKVKIGSIYGVIRKIEPGQEPAAK